MKKNVSKILAIISALMMAAGVLMITLVHTLPPNGKVYVYEYTSDDLIEHFEFSFGADELRASIFFYTSDYSFDDDDLLEYQIRNGYIFTFDELENRYNKVGKLNGYNLEIFKEVIGWYNPTYRNMLLECKSDKVAFILSLIFMPVGAIVFAVAMTMMILKRKKGVKSEAADGEISKSEETSVEISDGK